MMIIITTVTKIVINAPVMGLRGGVKRARADDVDENKVERLVTKMRGDARNVSVHEIDAFIEVLGMVRIHVGDDFTIEDLITNTKDSDLEHILSCNIGRRAVGGNSVQKSIEGHYVPLVAGVGCS